MKNLERVHESWARSPENLEHLASVRSNWLESPEGEAAFVRFVSSGGMWLSVGEDLRERDGDLCQLCLEPVDFDLPIRTPMSRTVDHIVPTRAGGSDEMDNLWVAHMLCNQHKGARHLGRPDGTTDVREET